MNNRTTLFLLLGIAAAAGGARLYSGHLQKQHDAAFTQSLTDYKYIWETVEELRVRRAKYAVADDDKGYFSHFQKRAEDAEMGRVNPTSKERPRNNFTDAVYTIEFYEADNLRFARGQIVNLIYNSENLMPRTRCTTLNLTPATVGPGRSRRGVPAGEERDDLWKVDALVFTQRTPKAIQG